MNREQALSYIHGAHRPGHKAGPDRMLALLEQLGNPHRRLRFVHVAGTNGKGSTTTMLAEILRRAGYRTGRFISPYLERFEERITVDGQEIPERDLCAAVETAMSAVERLQQARHTPPTEFELVTALGLLHFANRNCDIVALETGIGGARDVTNVIDTPEAAVLTSISFDHQKQLGGTLAEIAAQKAGIIKPGGRSVVYPCQAEEVWPVLHSRAVQVGASLACPDPSALTILSETLEGSHFQYAGLDLFTPMPGRHQIYNALTVVETARVLAGRGFDLPDGIVAGGIAGTRFAGRFELLATSPHLVLDGAHNQDGVRVLHRTVRALLRPEVGRLIVVMGMMADKDWRTALPLMAGEADLLILTRPPDPRALDPREALEALCLPGEVRCCDSGPQALALARSLASPQDAVLACGSIYLIGELRSRFDPAAWRAGTF
ncbi:MAG: bifunctional folylpolyglutamate synthase/dihydrofolate synthase [Clostridiales bacterium]|nr:bifunctional folylpolyglutamate synthase/dihydrofolate synthase [Clostridiales bacterium]